MAVREGVSVKSRSVAFLLCAILGWLGAHRFYVGKIGTGILMIVTFAGLGVWLLIDLVIVTLGMFRDKQGRLVFRWFEEGSI